MLIPLGFCLDGPKCCLWPPRPSVVCRGHVGARKADDRTVSSSPCRCGRRHTDRRHPVELQLKKGVIDTELEEMSMKKKSNMNIDNLILVSTENIRTVICNMALDTARFLTVSQDHCVKWRFFFFTVPYCRFNQWISILKCQLLSDNHHVWALW